MRGQVLKAEYDMTEMPVTAASLENFELFDDRRRIRSSQVESLLTSLKAGKHFGSPLVINKIGKRLRIIDGNHRYEALKSFLTANPEKTVMVKMAVYKNLNQLEERQVYTTWSLGIKQNIDDLLSLRKKEIPIYQLLLNKEFPVCIYRTSGSESVPLKLIIQMIYGTYNASETYTDRYPHRLEIVEVAKTYGKRETSLIVDFFDLFRDVFGKYGNNIYMRTVFLSPLFNVYVLNGPLAGYKGIKERFMKLVADPEIMLRLREHSRDSRLLMRERIYYVCDRGKRQKLYR